MTRLVVLALANVVAWTYALLGFHDHPALLGTALLAYVLGLRHAFDVDHIAAIDNVVRRLVQGGQPAETVGLFFSLGHSTVVVLASLAIAMSGEMLAPIVHVGALIGSATSAIFLLVVGVMNLVVLRSIWRSFVRVRRGELVVAEPRCDRFFGRVVGAVARAEHMYPLGFVFGLGFDTATEIGLLGISATGAAGGLSVWQVMVFPLLFTAGMTIVDTADSVLMVRAYAHAFVRPVRKLWYNLTMTGASVAVALLIGSLEALHLIGHTGGYEGAFWRTVARWNDDLPSLGVAVVAIFLASWAVSAAVYRWKGYDRVPVVLSRS